MNVSMPEAGKPIGMAVGLCVFVMVGCKGNVNGKKENDASVEMSASENMDASEQANALEEISSPDQLDTSEDMSQVENGVQGTVQEVDCGNGVCEKPGEDCMSCEPDCGSCTESCGAGSSGSSQTSQGCLQYKDIRYGNHERHILDIYLPSGWDDPTAKLPVLVWYHGGGLTQGSKEWVDEDHGGKADVLCGHGYAVVVNNYRLKPEYYMPAQIHDAKAAVRWARAHADVCHLDSNKVGVIGASAGATLAAVLGTTGDMEELEGEVGDYPGYSTTVQAALPMAGVYREFCWFVCDLSLCQQPECQKNTVLSAPMNHVSSDDSPFLVTIGDQDGTPEGEVDHRNFHNALVGAGVDSTLMIVPGAGHGDVFWMRTDEIIEFFNTHLKL
jgi:acetyl esterase/lipase